MRLKGSFDQLCNTRRRLIPYIKARYVLNAAAVPSFLVLCYIALTDLILQVGESHDSTKESSEYLKNLTQQAVVLQKAINQIYGNTPSACIPPPKVCIVWQNPPACISSLFMTVILNLICASLQFSTPSLPTILQQLNLTCGIILIPLR